MSQIPSTYITCNLNLSIPKIKPCTYYLEVTYFCELINTKIQKKTHVTDTQVQGLQR